MSIFRPELRHYSLPTAAIYHKTDCFPSFGRRDWNTKTRLPEVQWRGCSDLLLIQQRLDEENFKRKGVLYHHGNNMMNLEDWLCVKCDCNMCLALKGRKRKPLSNWEHSWCWQNFFWDQATNKNQRGKSFYTRYSLAYNLIRNHPLEQRKNIFFVCCVTNLTYTAGPTSKSIICA